MRLRGAVAMCPRTCGGCVHVLSSASIARISAITSVRPMQDERAFARSQQEGCAVGERVGSRGASPDLCRFVRLT